MTDAKRTQSERSEATRAALVAAARPLFGERGFAAVGAEEIVRAAGVTRGALYHQFADGKKGVFDAVFESVESEITEEVVAGVAGASSPLAAMRGGAQMFLEATLDPEVQRIILIDAPAVLGWERWREIAAEYGLGVIEAVVAEAIEAGEIPAQPSKPLAHLLMGALDEAVLMVARAEDQEAAKAEMLASLNGLLDGLANMVRR